MIEIKDVMKSFENKNVLNHLNVTISSGSIFGLIGPNGAGKSTLLYLLNGVSKCDEGSILFDGKEVYENPDVKKDILFISDDPYYFHFASIDEMKDFYLTFYPQFNLETYQHYVDLFRLPQNKPLKDYSKGMKRQAMFALALAIAPKYLLLDEAFDGLDPVMRLAFKKAINQMIDENMTVIISSHNLRELEDICDSFGILENGCMTTSGDLYDIKDHIHKIQIAFKEELNKEEFSHLDVLSFHKQSRVINMVVKGDINEIKDYFKYLIKQNKKYLILIYVVGIIIPFLTLNSLIPDPYVDYQIARIPGMISLIYGFALSCIVPIYLFSFLQKKKSNILYFSLPIKKESLYITTSLFSYFLTLLPVVIYQIIGQCITLSYGAVLSPSTFILAIFITIVHMLAVNSIVTFVILLAQNIVDSFICSFAYFSLPLVIYIALDTCATRVVDKIMLGTGNYTQALKAILSYASPVYNGLFQLNNLSSENVSRSPIIVWVIIGILLIAINYFLYSKRTIEQSETYTKSVFMYPLIITLSILSLLLFTYAPNKFKTNILPFGIIFMIYLIMYYFSKRKVYFTWKIPVLYIVLIISCVGFSSIYSNTQGFHTLYETPPASALKSASASFAFNTNYETRNPLIYKDVEVTDIGFNTHSRHAKEQKNLNKKFVKFINEIMDKKLITSYNGFFDEPHAVYYQIFVSYSTKNSNLHPYIPSERDYIIEEKNIKEVLDILAKYKLYKYIS